MPEPEPRTINRRNFLKVAAAATASAAMSACGIQPTAPTVETGKTTPFTVPKTPTTPLTEISAPVATKSPEARQYIVPENRYITLRDMALELGMTVPQLKAANPFLSRHRDENFILPGSTIQYQH